MIDIHYIREHIAELKTNIKNRQLDPQKVNVDRLLELDQEKKELTQQVEGLRQKRNDFALKINQTKDETEREEKIHNAKLLRKEIKKSEERLEKVNTDWQNLMDLMPNVTHPAMPIGKDSSGNVEIKQWGELKKHDFKMFILKGKE